MSTVSRILINAEKKLHPTNDLYGIFFEDINHAADGGLYAELVRNRSFEFCDVDNADYTPMTAWELIGRDGGKPVGGVESVYPLNVNNTHYLRISNGACHRLGAEGTVGVRNCGYNTGIPIREGEEYLFSVFARRDIMLSSPVEIRLESADGEKLYAKSEIVISSPEWTQYKTSLVSDAEDFSARLVILVHDVGAVCLDMVSLFPKKTFRGRENGLRPDIAQFLADMKPKFMRFPGGCLTHDGALDDKARNSMYRWKNSVGPLEARPSKKNNWRYNQTLGFGYYEFFLFCEDIGTKAMPVLPGAFNPHHQWVVPMEEMQPWVDDALELLEFANGDVNTKWGAYRAELGHPEPFNIEYIAIGNEEVDDVFFDRYPLFHKAIAEKYPNVKILNTAGPAPSGIGFDLGWESARKWNSYAVDEHYYVAPDWMIQNYERYFSDFYDPNGPKVFLGEYASRNNTFYNALCEAAYMTSFELNADKVALTCYAPLLCNTDYVSWNPNLIWYNNHEIFGIPSYYVQKMYSVNQGDVTLPVSAEITPEDDYVEPERISGGFAFFTSPGDAYFKGIKLDGVSPAASDIRVDEGDWSYSDGDLVRATPIEEKPAEPPRRRGMQPQVIVNGDYESFKFECKTRLRVKDEPTEENEHPRPFRQCTAITFAMGEDSRFTWMLGGWRGDESILTVSKRGYEDRLASAPFAYENGKEYVIGIERDGNHIVCTVDGEVVHDVTYLPKPARRIYVSSTLDEDANEVIVKAVNVRPTPIKMEIAVEGAGDGARTVKLETLTADSLDDRNSFEEPTKVATKYSSFEVDGVPFVYDFPASSVNIFRIPIIK